jgi:hypothetical protein
MGKRDVLHQILATFAADDAAIARSGHEGMKRVIGKYEKLRRAPYKLFRATNPAFIADLESLPEFWRMPGHEDALRGPLLGDPHPENFGAVGPSSAAAQIDCTDFDEPMTGPLARDLARAACGLALAEDQQLPKDKDDQHALARALDDAPSGKALDRVRLLATTWTERLLAGAGGLPDAAAFAPLRAAADTPIDAIKLDDGHAVADHPDRHAVEDALAGYAASAPAAHGARLVAAWTLHGMGASSFCVDRTIVRLALADAPECLVEWKPEADAPAVVQAFRERRDPATRDPMLGLASLRGVGHRAVRWMVDDQKIKSRDVHGPFADDVARLVAVRLAEQHRRAVPAVVARVRGQPAESIASALADLVAAYLPVLADEWRAFLAVPADELARRVAG